MVPHNHHKLVTNLRITANTIRTDSLTAVTDKQSSLQNASLCMFSGVGLLFCMSCFSCKCPFNSNHRYDKRSYMCVRNGYSSPVSNQCKGANHPCNGLCTRWTERCNGKCRPPQNVWCERTGQCMKSEYKCCPSTSYHFWFGHY